MEKREFKYDLTIGMIVKNEEKYLEDCLKALLPLKDEITCQIIVTDTGSTDKTIEIAEKYADEVLHFEWCSDFSKARNTGVDAAKGAWFMFADADEIFDESVMEIAKFIKSKDRDNYDNNTVIIRNIYDLNKKNEYSDFKAIRLFNFTKGKRRFINSIHEVIPALKRILNINAISLHYGYLNDIITFKNQRNRVLIEDELSKNTNDLRIRKQLMDVYEYEEKIELANKSIKILDDDEKNGYKNIRHINFIFVIYCVISMEYINRKRYDLILEICQEFFNKKVIMVFEPQINLPILEMHYYYSIALYNTNQLEKAIYNMETYQIMYENLQKKTDNIFGSLHPFKMNNEHYQIKGQSLILLCYRKLNDNENLSKYLKQYQIFKYKNSNDEYEYLSLYIKFCIYCKNIKAINSVIEFLKSEKFDIYNYGLILYAKMILRMDISDYLQNCRVDELIYHIKTNCNTVDKNLLEKIYMTLKYKTDYVNLKEMLVYINLMSIYITNTSANIIKDNKTSNINSNNVNVGENVFNHKENFNEIFELYIKNVYLYVKIVYNEEILQTEQFELLSSTETFGYLVYPSLEQKNDNMVNYIKSLKNAITYCPQFKDIVTNIVEIIQENLDKNSNIVPETNNEFQLLSEQIKLTIIEAIKSNEIEKAKMIIEEYKKINPTDPDIEKFMKHII